MAAPDRLVAPALGALWTHRGRLRFAWDVLRHGVCNDCSLGSAGLSDGVLPGAHLCSRRVRRLARYTADALDPALLADASGLRGRDRRALKALGRIAQPMLWRAGTRGFKPIQWTDATHLLQARLRDSRADAAWSLLVEPADVDLETLFQLARVASLLERRDRPGDLPPLVDLLVDEAERRLRTAAFARGGTWGSTTTLGGLDIGDPVAVVSNGDHPLLDPTVDALRRRGVLVERTRELRADVRHTLVYGRPGVLAALEVGLPLADEAPTEEALARLSAAWIVGEHPGTAPRCAFRAHQAAFLDPAMLAPAGEAVLLLPSALPTEHPGGATFLADDGTLRFSPRVLGHAVEGPRPGWEIAVQVAAHADVDGATDLAAHDASELRACIAATLPRLAGVGALAAPGDTAALRA